MKVSVTITVDIDSDAWRETFGLEEVSSAQVRQDVKTYIGNGMYTFGVLGNGEIGNVDINWR